MALLTLADFRLAVLNDFPRLKDVLEDDGDLPHLLVAAFTRLTQRAKDAGDWETYERSIRLVARLLPMASADLENALHVSLLEHLDFAGPHGPKAWSLLTPQLQAAWRRIKRLADRPQARGHDHQNNDLLRHSEHDADGREDSAIEGHDADGDADLDFDLGDP
jgi:hypothetical protein